MAKKAETVFKERVRPLLEALPNSWVEKIQQKTIRGTPDFLVCLRGMFCAIELKTDEGVLDPLQRYKLTRIAHTGGIAMILTPTNFEESYKFLKEIAGEPETFSDEIIH